jgi:hypothetical protein
MVKFTHQQAIVARLAQELTENLDFLSFDVELYEARTTSEL